MLISSSKLFFFSKEVHLNSGVRLLLELYYVIVIKNVAFFTILGEINHWPRNVPVNSKTAHSPPPGNPRAFDSC